MPLPSEDQVHHRASIMLCKIMLCYVMLYSISVGLCRTVLFVIAM